ncbi:hypothetical protein CRUP_033339 [Coryphaenoides rupestris]|nr:hypothetical protein CRUP_033339 [Coryphaenoides rupestris]
MCVTRRSEMPGHDSSARLKAFSSSSMAPTPPPAARLFSFSWEGSMILMATTSLTSPKEPLPMRSCFVKYSSGSNREFWLHK